MLDTKIKREPTMEEILQTIRKVVSQDMDEEKKNPDENEEEILELTEEIKDDGTVASVEEKAADVIDEIDSALEDKQDNAKEEESQQEDSNKKESLEHEKTQESEAEDQSLEPQEAKAEDSGLNSTENEESKEEVENESKNDISENSEEESVKKAEETEVKLKSENHRLVSSDSAKIATEAIKALVKSTEKPSSDGLKFRSGLTVEELIIEAIRPELSQWLDKNLPGIVKSVVEKEIKHLMPKDD